MIVVGVRFKPAGKIYYFDPATIELKLDDGVIVETARGMEFGMSSLRRAVPIRRKSSSR